MSYFDNLISLIFDGDALWILLELLFVTSCISTIILILSKNEYISFLSSAPIFYLICYLLFYESHLMLIILAMSVQSIVINLINLTQKVRNKKIDRKIEMLETKKTN
ncbi:hypothetical protein LG296_21265 (plasmid) [Ureibacillus chungkukjangi]|uniref:hypothetical protein n=1 Tax=Ureibacillus chungkukjangi TaxID=1202712 RepID=UPI00384DA347